MLRQGQIDRQRGDCRPFRAVPSDALNLTQGQGLLRHSRGLLLAVRFLHTALMGRAYGDARKDATPSRAQPVILVSIRVDPGFPGNRPDYRTGRFKGTLKMARGPCDGAVAESALTQIVVGDGTLKRGIIHAGRIESGKDSGVELDSGRAACDIRGEPRSRIARVNDLERMPQEVSYLYILKPPKFLVLVGVAVALAAAATPCSAGGTSATRSPAVGHWDCSRYLLALYLVAPIPIWVRADTCRSDGHPV